MIKSKFTFFEMRMKSAKGQIAIFVVLIFQAIFILFAMTINISLAVYDKINFQNSLDLAAYYGAKQQAEVLNAMAHINYQMRQNWKLLTWRYRILGTLLQDQGVPSTHPNSNFWCPQNQKSSSSPYYCNKDDQKCRDEPPCPQNCDTFTQLFQPSYQTNPQGYCDYLYFICISHDSWNRGIKNANQNLCKTENVEIPPVTQLQLVPGAAGIIPVAVVASYGINILQGEINKSCPMEGALNALITQFFLTHFRLDQRDRKRMMQAIYEKSLGAGKDLDGKSIFEGAKKVFYNNLSQANKNSANALPHYGLKDFNSFQGEPFEKVFRPFNVFPVLQFLNITITGNSGQCNAEVKQHYKPLDSTPNILNSIINQLAAGVGGSPHPLHEALNRSRPRLKPLFDLNHKSNFFRKPNPSDSPLQNLTLGFFKKPKKILYYSLKGEFTYKSRIFALNSPGVKFKASAFAKAFGGRFGPQPKQSDPLIPILPQPGDPSPKTKIPDGNVNPIILRPNYSRWPGDQLGLIDRKMHDPNRTPDYDPNTSAFLHKQAEMQYQDKQKVWTIEAFFHLMFFGKGPQDPLARPPVPNNQMRNTFMRMMELMAVYPDAYDLSYYSISGNYMETYFPRICKLLESNCDPRQKNQFSSQPDAFIRGDFGWPDSTEDMIEKNWSKMSADKRAELSIAPYFLKGGNGMIKINPSMISKPPPRIPPGQQPRQPINNLFGPYLPPHNITLSQGQIFYPWLAQDLPAHLLSSWTPRRPKDYDNYTLGENVFLKCDGKALKDMPSASACVKGGRSGYSVKLISCETVKNIRDETESKMPSDLDEYCGP